MNFPSRSTSLHTDVAGTAPPDAFGPFRVLHQIGAGALGPVFRAYDPDQDRLVAVKWFRLDLPPERTHRLVAELEQVIAADLTHPAVAAPLAAGIVNAAPYLAQDFVAAESVDLVIRQHGAMPLGEAVRIATSVAGALDAAATAQIVHGALHPRDVLVSVDDVRLTGLGIAGAVERVGSVPPMRRPYTAPERVSGAATDRRADVFSLGVLVHEWLWAKRVTGDGRQTADALTELPGADLPRLRHLFGRALARDPNDRFDTASEFTDELVHALMPGSSPGPRIRRAPAEPRLPLEGADEVALLKVPIPQVHAADLDLGPAAAAPRALAAEAIDAAHAEPIDDVPVETQPTLQSGPAEMEFPSETETAALESTRSAAWPIGLTIVLGVSFGFAAGYEVARWQRGSESNLAPAAAPAPASEPGAADSSELSGSTAAKPAAVAAASSGNEPPTGGDRRAAVSAGSGAAVQTPATATGAVAGTREPGAATHEPAAAPTPPGRILVRSTPSGARVVLDGRAVGQTPLAMRELDRGVHIVRLAHDGYIAVERRVTITAERPAQSITVILARVGLMDAAPASAGRAGQPIAGLVVESRPPGATVLLDGKAIGRTPLEVGELAPGEHGVSLELDGYRRWSSSVRVAAGQRGRVAASLDR